MRTVGLGERLQNRPGQLSGGQQQRVAVARALVSRPDIVFADEPTGALDSRTGTEILGFMRSMVDETGQTIVMVTHDPHAASFADNVLFLADGRITDEMAAPTVDQVLDRMKRFEVCADLRVELVTPFRRETAGIELDEGSYDDLGPGTVVLLGTQVASGGGVGPTALFTDSNGDVAELEVVGVIGISLDAMVTGSIVDPDTFDAFVGDTAPTFAFVKTSPGAQTDVEDAIANVTDLRPDVSVQAGNVVGRIIGQIFDFLISAVNGLLLMSVIVALIGIVNTMTLSILERRRELGLLRIVGMVDRRVRRMVRIESVLIAALGTISGMLLGAFSGFALITAISRLSDAAIDVSFPPLLLGAILALGIGLGVVAALIPAQRSTRLDVLDAIQPS